MAYRVDLTARAGRNLRTIYLTIEAENSKSAGTWFNGLERAILGLNEHPGRCPVTPEDPTLRHLIYGTGRVSYRIIFAIDDGSKVVTVLHIRHGARRLLVAPSIL